MELTVTQENLARALSSVGRVASAKAGLPILNNILLRTDGTRLLIAATNLEIAVTHYIGAKIVKPGSLTIPAKLAAEFVSNLPKGQIELKVQNDHLHINSGGYHSVINGVIADDFPELPTIDESAVIRYNLKVDDFKQAVNQTIITASSDTTRPVLTGIYWHTHEHHLYLAATDGYRLSERQLMETKNELSAIVPASSLQEVLRTLTEDIEEVEMLFDDTQVRFRIGESEITSRLIDGKFPDYRQLIPAQSETSITTSKADLIRVTKIASLFAREAGGSITITASDEANTVSIQSIASQVGEATSEIEATVTAAGQVTLNSRYLSEALSVVDGETVEFRFSGKISPCVLTATEATNYKHIIMPLKS